MNAKKCDRCGTFYEKDANDTRISKAILETELGVSLHAYDLCETCASKILQFFVCDNKDTKESEIHIGDIVIHDDERGIVLDIENETNIDVYTENGLVDVWHKNEVSKTNSTFDVYIMRCKIDDSYNED